MRRPYNYKARITATVLAALRLFQDNRGGFDRPEWYSEFTRVAGGPLSNEAIDQL